MVGRHNSVLKRIRARQPDVFSFGCVCHLAALCAAAALKKLPVSIDGLLIDIHYHFKHSSKRCEEFAQVRDDFEGIAPLSIIKHCSTRWLSLEKVVKRLLTLWPALRAYFDQERDANDRAQRVADMLMKVETKLWCHFISFTLKLLNTFNTALQTSASKIGTLQHDISQLLRSYLTNFVLPECLADVTLDSIYEFNFCDTAVAVPDSELGIGTGARLLLEEEADSIEGTHQEVAFFAAVREFYKEVVHKMVSKFPFRDSTIRDLSLLDPKNRQSVTSSSAIRLAKRFASVTSHEELDGLDAELRDYKSMPENQLPSVDVSSATALDHFWQEMGDLTQPGDIQQKRFRYLSHLCKVLLVLPHTTADPERLFSMVRKIETDHRGSLLPSTLASLLSVKLNTDEECYNSCELFTPSLLQSVKSATERSVAPGKGGDSSAVGDH